MGELVILSDVRGWVPKDRTELLLEWRLMGEQLALDELAARVAIVPAPRPERACAPVLPLLAGRRGVLDSVRGARG